MTPPDSYLGIQFTQAQKDMLATDLLRISALTNQIIDLDRQIAAYNADYEYYVAQYNNCSSLPNATKKQREEQGNCFNFNANLRNVAEANRSSVQTQKNAITSLPDGSMALAKRQYDNDLIAIQNDIKLQIQINTDKQANENQDTSNQAYLNQNNPALLTQKQKDDAALALKKQSDKTKTTIFIIAVIVISIIGFFTIKRLIA